ncbi:MAG: glycerophosphodiester phosphodiesterase [Rhodothalassiaceae bacterium]
MRSFLTGALMMLASAAFAQSPFPTIGRERPIVIAHRGASGALPEHTLEGYRLAIELGADYIEPDLVLSRDGVLVARHDYYLSASTDIAAHPEFADRKRKIEGREDWFVEDFTLAELRTLRARQAFPGRDSSYDGLYLIPTFEEILDLIDDMARRTGRQVGVYPETKHPAHYKALGLDFVPPLLAALRAHGFEGRDSPVFIQSFEPDILREIAARADYRLIMLLFPQREIDATAPEGVPQVALEEVAGIVYGVGPSKDLLIDAAGQDRGFVARAHELGLAVHVWTMRDDRIAPPFATIRSEYRRLFSLGVDGFFSDFPGTAVLERGLAERRAEAGLPLD